MAQPSRSTILIVGAGPTGLVLALWLRKKNIPFRIIDKSTSPGETSRALGIQARTLEFYRQLGIDKEIVDTGIPVHEIIMRRRGRLAARAKFGAMGEGITPFPHPIFLSQDVHEEILNARLAELGVHVERQTELVEVSQDDRSVTAKLTSPRGEETVISAYVCGCDGAHSRVREDMGIGFPGGTYNQVFFVADVNASGEMAESGVQVSVSGESFCIVMPIEKKGSVRLTGIVPPEKAHKETIEFADVEESVKRDTGLKVQNVNWFSNYHVHHRVADHFRKGRVFLAGDAGHIHSPAGAQGMNTGIGDAVNLAWKLAAVVQQHASDRLLDTYEPERIAFARRLVKSTDTAFKIIASESLIGRLWRTYVMPRVFAGIVNTTTGLRFMFKTISQTGIRYRASPLSEGKCGEIHAGDRLPWVKTSTGDNYEGLESLDWQVHVYGSVERSFQSAMEAEKMAVHQLEWSSDAEAKGFVKNAVYLNRPDGYVGLTNTRQDADILKAYLTNWTPGLGLNSVAPEVH